LVAQEWLVPALTVFQLEPAIRVGVFRLVVVPSPNFPLPLEPQHHNDLNFLIPHVWLLPLDIEAQGVEFQDVVEAETPLPSIDDAVIWM
jgi:hypothetical protein